MLSIYLRLFKYSFQHGPVEAIQRLMVQRFGFESEVSDFSQIARHTYTFRVVMFVFSIWSMIRLFTYEGMILTKLWAAVYLASFLTIEGLVFVSRTCLHQPWPQAQLQPDGVDAAPDFMPDASGPQSLPYQSIALSVAFALYFGMEATQAIFEKHGHAIGHLHCVGIVLLVCGITPAILISMYAYTVGRHAGRVRFARSSGVLLLAVVIVPGCYLISWINSKPGDSTVSRILGTLMIGFWVGLYLWWAGNTLEPVVLAGREVALKAEYFLSRYFFCFNITIALLFYRSSYELAGTKIPSWAESLGN